VVGEGRVVDLVVGEEEKVSITAFARLFVVYRGSKASITGA
jgi:hypothetical protein